MLFEYTVVTTTRLRYISLQHGSVVTRRNSFSILQACSSRKYLLTFKQLAKKDISILDFCLHKGSLRFREEIPLLQVSFALNCHVPYFLGPSPLFSSFPVTFPPVPACSMTISICSVSLHCLSDLFRHLSLPWFPSISVHLFVSTRFLSVFHIRIQP